VIEWGGHRHYGEGAKNGVVVARDAQAAAGGPGGAVDQGSNAALRCLAWLAVAVDCDQLAVVQGAGGVGSIHSIGQLGLGAADDVGPRVSVEAQLWDQPISVADHEADCVHGVPGPLGGRGRGSGTAAGAAPVRIDHAG